MNTVSVILIASILTTNIEVCLDGTMEDCRNLQTFETHIDVFDQDKAPEINICDNECEDESSTETEKVLSV